MGRKNCLFSDTPDGAEASMIVSFMIETGKANGIDPLKYLAYLPEHRPDADIKKTLENILWIFKGFIKSLTLLVINAC
ncbi:MAG: IS66 family transposase [Lachnospiraceae bacterium]|nr:IS66 family transposase [Lachnospiraceae bacterium]